LPKRKWHRFVDGEDDGETEQKVVDDYTLRLLDKYAEEAFDTSAGLRELEAQYVGPINTLERRWAQIQEILSILKKRIKNEP